MKKFKIKYTRLLRDEIEVEAMHDLNAIEEFREEHPYCNIDSVEYVYQGDEDLKEFYCIWWNGNSWKSKIVKAHDQDEINYNIKEKLDHSVYNFQCCLNTKEAIEGLHRCIWD